MTDYKQLCADLLAWSEKTSSHYYSQPGVIIRARAALAEPEPEWPTDEEIMELMPQQMRDDLAAAARALSVFDPDNIKAASVFRIILNRHAVDHARAVLARWGNHPESPDSSTQPIPVSERLPRPEDCDEEGRCWGFHQYNPEDDDIWESWYLVPTQHLLPSVQWLGFSHWLPAHALPQPS